MVVIATPAPHAPVPCCQENSAPQPLSAVSVVGQNILSAPVSTLNGAPVLTRMRSFSFTQGQCATLEWQLHDRDGAPVDLRPLGFIGGSESSGAVPDFKIGLRLKEQLALGNAKEPTSIEADVIDAEKGLVRATLTANMVGLPGVYYGEMALVSREAEVHQKPCVIFSNTFYVIISRSTFGPDSDPGGPPSLAEIRLHLRDSSPGESFLLDNLMFDDAEIALAIGRPVMYWNETPPPINTYTTQNFPFRYHWLEGICANLFLMVAESFRRNQFMYTAGGVQIDDQNKEVNYERAGQTRWQGYREWVRAIKASINLESCYGEVTSNYKYSAYTDAIRIRY